MRLSSALRFLSARTRPFATVPLLAGLLLAPLDAQAFCRQRTCQDRTSDNPKGAYDCETGEDGCISEGEFLFRTSACFSYGVQAGTAASVELTDDEFNDIIKEAFHVWETANCGGGRRPRLEVQSVGAVVSSGKFTCQKVPSANLGVWMLVDSWNLGHDPAALGYTSSRFDPEIHVGQVVDSDVELNLDRVLNDFRTVAERRKALLSIATHEAGHFLGLSHSQNINPLAIMAPRANNSELLQGKDLTADDIDGICSIYPPEEDGELKCSEAGYLEAALSAEQCDDLASERANDKAEENACSVSRPGSSTPSGNSGSGYALLAGIVGVALTRRRR